MRSMRSITLLCLAGAVLVGVFGVLLPGGPIRAQQPPGGPENSGILDEARFLQQAVSEIRAEAARRTLAAQGAAPELEEAESVFVSPPSAGPPEADQGLNATAGTPALPETAAEHEMLEMLAGPAGQLVAQSASGVPQGEAKPQPTIPAGSGYVSNSPGGDPQEDSPATAAGALRSAPQGSEDWRTLRIGSGEFTPAGGLDAETVSGLSAPRAGGRTATYGFLLLNVLLNERIVGNLNQYGITVLGPHDTFLKVRFPADEAVLAQVLTLAEVEWIGYSPAAFKLDHELATPSSSLSSRAQVNASQAELPLAVSLFDSDPTGAFRLAIERTGAVVGNWDADLLVYNVAASPAAINEILRLDFVLFIEPIRPLTTQHDQSVPLLGADYIRPRAGASSRYSGASVAVGILDSGLYFRHAAFGGKTACGRDFTYGNSPWIDRDGHGTHVLGTISGTGGGNRRYTGMAPGVGRYIGNKLGLRVAKVFDDDGDGPSLWGRRAAYWLGNPEFRCGRNGPGSLPPYVVNFSGGSEVSPNYGSDILSRTFDQVVWSYRQLYVVAAGNAGPELGTIGSPAGAKNVLAVANVQDSVQRTGPTGRVAQSSSRGPTADGRLKPNVAAPGEYVTSAEAGTSRGYVAFRGTSMAAPHVAGVAATVMQHYPAFRGRPAMMRAFLMATTLPTGSREKFLYGFGTVSSYLSHWANFSKEGWRTYWAARGAAANGSYRYVDVSVPPGASQLAVTMTWDEPPSSAGARRAVIYDLDLWLDRLGGGVSCGTRGQCGERASTSRTDNVEYIVLNNPPAGRYRLKLYSRSAPRSFSLPTGLAVVVVSGSTRPLLNVRTTPSTVTTTAGGTFVVRTSVTSSSWIAGGVTQELWSRQFGVHRVQAQTADGVSLSFSGARFLTLGAIPYGGRRSAAWTLRAPRVPGLYRLLFRTRSLNGPISYASKTVRVTTASGRNLSKATATMNTPDAGVQGLSGFMDDPIVPGVTVVKAAHLNELRIRIDALRSVRDLPPFNWTDPTLGSGVPIRAMHFDELRTALNQAYDGAGLSRPGYTDAESGTVIEAMHAEELRLAVAALEER